MHGRFVADDCSTAMRAILVADGCSAATKKWWWLVLVRNAYGVETLAIAGD